MGDFALLLAGFSAAPLVALAGASLRPWGAGLLLAGPFECALVAALTEAARLGHLELIIIGLLLCAASSLLAMLVLLAASCEPAPACDPASADQLRRRTAPGRRALRRPSSELSRRSSRDALA